MIQENDIEQIFGKRRCGPVPTKSAFQDEERVNAAATSFFKTLIAAVPATPDSDIIIRQLTALTLAARALIPIHDRVGIPHGQSRLSDMEATIRLATECPDQFAAFDLAGLKKRALEARKAGAT